MKRTSEDGNYCRAVERFQDWCEAHDISFVAASMAAFRLFMQQDEQQRDQPAPPAPSAPDRKRDTPSELAARIDLAKKHLAETDLSIGDIAARIGMRKADRLYQSFKKHTGQTCAEFRRANRRSA